MKKRKMSRTPQQRFDAFCFPPDSNGCIRWKGGRVNSGYGFFPFGEKSAHVLAHRFCYEQFYGLIPIGMEIDHLCRVRDCVNPKHLEAVSPQENKRRQFAVITHCPKGHSYSEENTRWRGHSRKCRQCDRDKKRQLRGTLENKFRGGYKLGSKNLEKRPLSA